MRMETAPVADAAAFDARPLGVALGRLAAAARAAARLGAVAARALRRGARLRRHLPRGARAGRLGAVPGRRRRARCCGRARRSRRQRQRASRPTSTTGSNSEQQLVRRARSTGRQPLFNRANTTTIAQSERTLESSLADLDAAEQDLMLRVSQAYFDVLGAQDTLHDDARQQDRDRRAAGVGQAQLRGRHGHDHRHARGAGALRPGDGAGDRRRQRPASPSGSRSTSWSAAATSSRRSWPCRWCCRDARGRRRRVVEPRRRGASDGAPGAGRLRRRRSSRPRRRARRGCRRSTRSPRSASRPRHGREPRSPVGQLRRRASACSSTCRSTPAARSRTGSRRRSLLEERSRNDLEAARRGVTQATRQAYYTLQSGAAQVKALEAAEASSQLALEATQLGYRVGIRVNVDVLNAQSQLYQTQRDLARARYDVLLNDAAAAPGVGAAGAERRPGDRQVARALGASNLSASRATAREAHFLTKRARGALTLRAARQSRHRIGESYDGVVTLSCRRRSRRIGSGSARPTSAVVGGDAAGWLQAQIGPADPPRGSGLLDTPAGARARRRASARRGAGDEPATRHDRRAGRSPATTARRSCRRRALAPRHRGGDPAAVRRAAAVVLGQPLHRLACSRARPAAWSARSSATRSGRTSPAASRPCWSPRPRIRRCCATSTTAQSAGPHSRVVALEARRAARRDESARVTGINENLAREVLELHTLGAEGARNGALHPGRRRPPSPRC